MAVSGEVTAEDEGTVVWPWEPVNEIAGLNKCSGDLEDVHS